MNFKTRLERLQKNLENFDLEIFFHDDTFFEMLEDRELLEKNIKLLNSEELDMLYNIDRIIDSYYNIYKNKNLTGYSKMSFEILENIDKISSSYLLDAA
jgi:hypothetical protein